MNDPDLQTPAPGQLLDQKYELIDCLGQGGCGAVLLARHVYMDRDVAIKVLHPFGAADETLVARFFREAKLTSRLKHPNIITAHDFGMADGIPYLVMEYVPGSTLRELLRTRGSLSAAELIPIALDIARALVAAHEFGIVHRDLKPENVLLSHTDHGVVVKVLDFGIAKLCHEDHSETTDSIHTDPGVFQGTPRYAAPEQIRSETTDCRADIYSFGVMLYEAIVGAPPFESPSAIELVMQHLSSDVVPPTLRRPELDCPPALEALIMKCLEKESAARFVDARSLVHLLEEMATPKAACRRRPRWQPVGAVGAAAMLLCGAIIQNQVSAGAMMVQPSPAHAATQHDMIELSSADQQYDALFTQAKASYYAGAYSDAAPIFRAILARRPGDTSSQLLLALSYKRLGRAEEAIQLLEGLDPSLQASDRVSYQLAVLNAQIGKLEEALSRLQQAVKVNGALKQQAKNNPVFEPLARDRHFQRRFREILDEPMRTARRLPPEPRRSFSLERSFGRMLEGLHDML